MVIEYALRCNDGSFWGFPTKHYISLEAATSALEHLNGARVRMEQDSVDAYIEINQIQALPEEEIEAHGDRLKARLDDLAEAVDRWTREKDRSWEIVFRKVSEWQVSA